MSESTISVVGTRGLLTVFGTCDQHLRKIRDALGVSISSRNDAVHIRGDDERVAQATEVLEQLQAHARVHGHVDADDVDRLLADVCGNGEQVSRIAPIEVYSSKVSPRTRGQARYIEAVRRDALVFCTGPAGSGKSYLAVAMAVAALKAGMVRKIVLVRPAVEAGESLGFLPGDLRDKILPYLRPLLDALHEMMDHEMIRRYTEEGIIEIVPLAYMRGRTLNEAFMILDEAQNTTVGQMKMFLTRMGMGSRIVATGDVTQIDLPDRRRSGLLDALKRLRHVEGASVIELRAADIVRHPLVQRVVDAYEVTNTPR